MNKKVTGIALTSIQGYVVDNGCFNETLIQFLKRSAEIGLDIQQVITNIFDEAVVHAESDAPFDGTLSAFSMLVWDELKLRLPISSKILDILVSAALDKQDIYELIDVLETRNDQLKGNTPKLIKPQAADGPYPGLYEASGVRVDGVKSHFVIRFPSRRDRRDSDSHRV